MVWVPPGVVVVMLLGVVLAAAVAVVSWHQRPDPMALPLTALMLASLLWAIPYTVSLVVDDPGQASVWFRLGYPGGLSLPAAYLVVAIAYAGYKEWLTRALYVVLAVVPVCSVTLAWASGITDLFWIASTLEAVDGVTIVRPVFGPWHPIHVGYIFGTIGIAFVLLGWTALKAGRVRRRQVLLFLFGGAVPVAFNVLFRLGVDPMPAVDFTAAATAIAGIAFWVALYSGTLRNLPPAAYQNVPSLLGDAVLVFDPGGRLIEANGPAHAVLEDVGAGKTATDLLGDTPDSLDGDIVSPAHSEYEVRSSPVVDWRGNQAGTVVVLRDVTELKANERRLSVANRILRHNLRNELTIILGELERLAEDPDDDKALTRAKTAATRLSRLSEKARHIRTSTDGVTDQAVAVDLVAVAESVLSRHRERTPAADLTLEAPTEALVATPDRETVETILENVLENAVEHYDRSQPSVAVTVEPGDPVVLEVADDGPGIPAAERRPVTNEEESQLEHASGLGLWLVRWLTEAADGSVEFTDRDPRGTIVRVRLPAADGGESRRRSDHGHRHEGRRSR